MTPLEEQTGRREGTLGQAEQRIEVGSPHVPLQWNLSESQSRVLEGDRRSLFGPKSPEGDHRLLQGDHRSPQDNLTSQSHQHLSSEEVTSQIR